jgi:hypothetical protein
VSGDYARWLASETTAALTHDTPACPVCRDTGIVRCAETDPEDGVYEMACPDPAHDGQPCPVCAGRGWLESDHCNCGTGPSGYYGMHERHCGLEPCPRGCPFVPPETTYLAAQERQASDD